MGGFVGDVVNVYKKPYEMVHSAVGDPLGVTGEEIDTPDAPTAPTPQEIEDEATKKRRAKSKQVAGQSTLLTTTATTGGGSSLLG